ncbi:hypothetical protein [Polaromonas sp.]|uniref:hypothetical protein n=1 Tax=Polaromonas sp. TaxID=1869339 RepID=UPI001A22CA70|nr:hypothetical protein [Burkholderiales bacterium]
MGVLKIALLGASAMNVSQLAAALNEAVNATGWQALVTPVANPLTLPADLAGFGLLLLMGLEFRMPFPASSIPSGTMGFAQEAADQSIRAALAHAALSYQVLYGANKERLAHALCAIERQLPHAKARTRQSALSGGAKNKPWVWMCDKCSDPQCEHRLLTALRTQGKPEKK